MDGTGGQRPRCRPAAVDRSTQPAAGAGRSAGPARRNPGTGLADAPEQGAQDHRRCRTSSQCSAAPAERADYRPKALEDVPACADFYQDDEPPPEEELQQEREALPFRKLPVDGSTRFPAYAHKWWNASGVEVDAGERYRIEASGAWIDKTIPAGADGYESKAWFLHLAEGSRRMEERPWFSLVAAIHPRPDLEANNPDSENMLTGLIESTINGVARIDDESSLLATPMAAKSRSSSRVFCTSLPTTRRLPMATTAVS
jgi:hypothetical protein